METDSHASTIGAYPPIGNKRLQTYRVPQFPEDLEAALSGKTIRTVNVVYDPVEMRVNAESAMSSYLQHKYVMQALGRPVMDYRCWSQWTLEVIHTILVLKGRGLIEIIS